MAAPKQQPWEECEPWQPSDCHDLLFLGSNQRVDLGNVPVGDLLDVALGALLVVLGRQLVFHQLLDGVIGVAAPVAHGDLGVLALAATLFAVSWYSAFGALLLLGALPLWLLFIVFLLRAARP